jgi:hypothetical protein
VLRQTAQVVACNAHLAADEHHADWSGRKGDVATTVGGGCLLGVALTAAADDASEFKVFRNRLIDDNYFSRSTSIRIPGF